MTFGESLREARVNRGWSRSRLIIAIRARLSDRTLTISQETIRDIEDGTSLRPRDTTIRVLSRVLPELIDTPQNPIRTISVGIPQGV